ncbi:hypothetical protein [Streptomyces sp. VMFN-G11Ma]|jgi:hypothetical protein|uniref:hypothetical protein n=1 Tax=Streptomyces sp. VMFN-G11Ma TaxID=2135609 RepID=UPI000D3BB8FB|nr:hypothetical protein [Streptomyces sp. VMFN-G11Ma]PTM86019.1 hypothetical protein C7821_11999 [Streptomyces sp. VMFN-G11Ma]
MELTVDLRWALVIADQLAEPPEVEDIPALEAAIARHASKNRADADNAWRAATLAATVVQLRPFACRNEEVAALYAYSFMVHAGEPPTVEAAQLVGMLTRVSTAEIGIDMLATFLRNARTT